MVQQNKSTPSLGRVLLNDYLASLPVLFALVFWVMYLVLGLGSGIPDMRAPGRTIGPEDAPIVLWMAIGVTVLGGLMAFWRICFIRGVFAQGMAVKGRIVRIKKIRLRGLQTSTKITFAYSHKGKAYQRKNWLLSWDSDKQEGDPVTLVLRPDKPGKALIREVFSP